MKKVLTLSLLMSLLLFNVPAFASVDKVVDTAAKKCEACKYKGTHGVNGKITPKSVGAGALSLLIWPGIGQLMNDNSSEKAATHAIIGFLPPFRIWSCYDAVRARQGGVWENRI